MTKNVLKKVKITQKSKSYKKIILKGKVTQKRKFISKKLLHKIRTKKLIHSKKWGGSHVFFLLHHLSYYTISPNSWDLGTAE